MTLLTAIVPTNNFFSHESNFLNLMKSIVGIEDIALILILDSIDKSELSRARQIQGDFPTVDLTIREGEFRSPGLARNKGISLSKSKWVAFWDFDDEPDAHKFINMCELGDSEDTDCVVGGFTKFDINKNESEKFELSAQDPISNICVNPGIWRMIFLKEKIQHIHFSSALMGEDQEFLLNFKIYNRKLSIYPDDVYKYKTGNKNQATQNSNNLTYLIPISRETLNRFGESDSQDSIYIAIFYVRQLLTLIANASPKIRFETLGRFLKFFVTSKNYRKKINVIRIIQENRHGK